MEIRSHAESIELSSAASSAVIVAEGLRSWERAGALLISRGPRFRALSGTLGRLRPVPDRLGVVSGAAETHAVVLAKNCRTEEMELTQRWSLNEAGHLCLELEFIVPPACAGLEKLGVELETPGRSRLFQIESSGAVEESSPAFDGLCIGLFFPERPVPAGIHRMNIVFIPEI